MSRPTFFTTESGDREFAKPTLPTLEAFLNAPSQSVSGNKQQHVARALGCTFHSGLTLAIFWSCEKRRRHFFPSSTHLSSVILAKATVVPFVQLHSSRVNFHCYISEIFFDNLNENNIQFICFFLNKYMHEDILVAKPSLHK